LKLLAQKVNTGLQKVILITGNDCFVVVIAAAAADDDDDAGV